MIISEGRRNIKLFRFIRVRFYLESLEQDKRRFNYDVAIITATPIEYKKVHMLASKWKEKIYQGDNARYEETFWQRNGRNYKVISSKLNQMGMPAAATVTTKIIEHFTPKYILMCGIAGGIDHELNYGDVIVATKVWDYCSGKYEAPIKDNKNMAESVISNFKPTSNALNATDQVINMQDKNYDSILEKIFKSYLPSQTKNAPKIWFGPLACGSSVIKNRAIVDEMVLKHSRNTLGIDMESYGVFYAVENATKPRPKAICIKAVSDFADKRKSNKYQDYAAEVSAKLSKELVLDLLEQD